MDGLSKAMMPLGPKWGHNKGHHNHHDVVSNHQPNDCLLKRLFRRRSKKTSNKSSASLALVRGIQRRPANSPHKGLDYGHPTMSNVWVLVPLNVTSLYQLSCLYRPNKHCPPTLPVEHGYHNAAICIDCMFLCMSFFIDCCVYADQIEIPGLYSLSAKTYYRQISWSLEAARFDVLIIVLLWNLTEISAAMLPRGLSNFKEIGKV